MKIRGDIEITGIRRIVIDQAFVWRRVPSRGKKGGFTRWVFESTKAQFPPGHFKDEHAMHQYILALQARGRRVWVSRDTLNIGFKVPAKTHQGQPERPTFDLTPLFREVSL